MDYELAKELKDAGFPQKEMFDTEDFNGQWLGEDEIYAPSLSELIEACGEIVLWKYDDTWFAGHGGERGLSCGETYFDDYPKFLKTGKAPEEAVSKLWLELNKK